MLKKALISVIIITAVLLANSAVYAQSDARYGKAAVPVFKLTSDAEVSKTFSREYLIAGNSIEGTVVTIDLYWFRAADKRSIIDREDVSEEVEKEGDWIFQQTGEYEVGASGLFAEAVKLNLGLNRIVLLAKDTDGNTNEITIEIKRFWEKQASRKVNGNTMNKFVGDMSNSINMDKSEDKDNTQ